MHEAPADGLTDAYPESEYWDDLARVTGGRTDEALARIVIRETATCRDWMARHGARFQPSLGGTLHLSRTNAFFLGGGKALMNGYYRAAGRLGVAVEYDARVTGLNICDGRFTSALVARPGGTEEVRAKTLVAAAGGFQANLEWLHEIWGDAADNFLIRGTPYDDGRILRLLMDAGARTAGDPSQCHAVAIDARAPRFDGGIITRVDCVSLGIAVNTAGPALLRRRRGFLAEALRDLGPAGRAAGQSARVYHHRCEVGRRVRAAVLSADRRRLDPGAGGGARARPRRVGPDRPVVQCRGTARHLQPCGAG